MPESLDKNKLAEWAWKFGTAILFPIMFLLAGWVWNTHTKVVTLEVHLEDVVADVKKNANEIEKLDDELDDKNTEMATALSDISHIKSTVDRIEQRIP